MRVWCIDIWHREPIAMLCGNPDGWDGDGNGVEDYEGEDICIPMASLCWCMAKTITNIVK